MKGTAIVTKFLGPSNTRGARVKATVTSGKSVTISWDHSLRPDENHLRVAARCFQNHVLDAYYSPELNLAPNVVLLREIHGLKSGYVVIVDMIAKDKAIQY